MPRKRKHISEGRISRGENKSAEELIDGFSKNVPVEQSFDPHDLTLKILEFGKMLTGITLYEYQEEPAYKCIYSIITFEGASVTLLTSRQCGKSETVSFVIITLMVILPRLAEIFPELEPFKDGFKAGVFAPQSEQVDNIHQRIRTRLGSENAALVMSDEDIDTGVVSYSRLTLDNGSVCSAQVASKNSKIEGKTLDLAVIDEAQDVDTLIATKSIEPMVSSTAGTIMRSGTTGRAKNNFYEEIQLNKKEDFKVKNKRLRFHYQYDYKAIISLRRKQFENDGKRHHLFYEKDVLKKKKRWGEQSEAWKLSYALIWTLETGMFCTDDKFDRLTNKRIKWEDLPIEGARYDMGIDWAKETNSTVVTVVRTEPSDEVHESKEEYAEDKPKKTLVAWYEFQNSRYEDQHTSIMELIYFWRPEVICADATGVGAAPTDRLMWNAPETTYILPFIFSRPSKSRLWQDFEADMNKGRLLIPAHKDIQATEEFQTFYNQVTSAVRYYVGDYLVVHKSGGSMDDYLDSMGLAIQASNHAVDVIDEIEDDENPFYRAGGDIYNKIYGNSL